MSKRWRWALLGGLTVFGLLLVYPLVLWWQMHQVRQLCAELRPGTPFAAIRPAIEKRGLFSHMVRYGFENEGGMGYYSEKNKTWGIGVPATLTMGDMECRIWHDGKIVIATRVFGP